MADINRLKIVLVEKKKTSKWLAEAMRKEPATIFKWFTNTFQLSLGTLAEIAKILDADAHELVMSTNNQKNVLSIQ